MRIAHHNSSPARTFVRTAIAKAISGGDPGAYALRRWGGTDGDTVAKAAIAAVTNPETTGGYAAAEFFNLVLEQSIVGKLDSLRRVALNVRMLAMTGGARGYWVSQGNPVPLSRPTINGAVLEPRSVNAIVVTPEEALRNPNTIVETALQDDLVRALAEALDIAFIDSANAGIAEEMPPAVTYGVTPIVATDDCVADLIALVEAFMGALESAYFVTDPVTATRLAAIRDATSHFIFPDLGPRGGVVLGIPVITSRSSPLDSNGGQIALIDGAGIAFGSEGMTLEKSNATTLAMSDSPSAPAEMVSMYQTNSVAFLARMIANWEVQRAGAVSVLTNCVW